MCGRQIFLSLCLAEQLVRGTSIMRTGGTYILVPHFEVVGVNGRVRESVSSLPIQSRWWSPVEVLWTEKQLMLQSNEHLVFDFHSSPFSIDFTSEASLTTVKTRVKDFKSKDDRWSRYMDLKWASAAGDRHIKIQMGNFHDHTLECHISVASSDDSILAHARVVLQCSKEGGCTALRRECSNCLDTVNGRPLADRIILDFDNTDKSIFRMEEPVNFQLGAFFDSSPKPTFVSGSYVAINEPVWVSVV